MIEIDKLKRNQKVIEDVTTVMSGALVAKKPCSIVIPFRWLQAGLLEIGRVNYVAAIFPLLNETGEYGVSNVCTKMEITPSSIEILKYQGEEHYVFRFDKGAIISPDIDLVMDSTFSYKIYDELIQKAKAPWFMNYSDVGRVMSTSKAYSGINLADTNAIFELIVSTLSFDQSMKKQYRETIDNLNLSTLSNNPRQGVPLNSVTYAAANKMNKLMGGYIEDGLTSALTEKESPVSGVEQLLRKQ